MGLLNKKDGEEKDERKPVETKEPAPRVMGVKASSGKVGVVEEEKPFVKAGDRVTVIHTNGQTGPETVGAVAEYGLLDIGELKQCRHISQGGPRPHWYRDSERETLDQSRERRVK